MGPATSSTLANRAMGVQPFTLSNCPGSFLTASSNMGVIVIHGATAFTRMPS
eukprot:CAMPEP_0172504708 /NCGR_PEP_ID=MMETSP1066-20121228/180639_1 /TAXON_ID=671091 /ORGANISM="Coscinodiscus wailesii, Strain CCMP2513" /LENGTH=51 /DNA_ID=CAMNT_0013280999 /DNA_START=129 /DNA_END=281 /DNA_ORIENTATION=+